MIKKTEKEKEEKIERRVLIIDFSKEHFPYPFIIY